MTRRLSIAALAARSASFVCALAARVPPTFSLRKLLGGCPMSPFRFLRPRPALAATALILVAAVSLTTFLSPPAAAQEPEPVDTPTQGICGRTAKVQALLINEIAREIARDGHTRTCEEVTAEDLASITTIFDPFTYLTTLQPGDLDGLTQLQSLRLYLGGEITELPAGLFAETPNLEVLSLPRQKIGELPAGIFDDVPKLGALNLYASELTSLPEEVFEHTPNLRILELADNKLAAVSKDTLDDVPELEILNLHHNRLTELPDNLFDNHTKLRKLDLSFNRIAALHEDTFDGLSQLTNLNLSGNKLPTLPEDVFEGLSNLTILELQDNPFTSVPVDVFEGLTSLTSLWTNLPNVSPEYFEHVPQLTKLFVIAGSQSIPEDSFHKLTDLERLTLGYGDITSLPADAFDGLSELKWLDLAGNKLTSLDEDIFDGLTSLESLRLLGNELTSLDEDIFEGLTSLETLYLGSNQESTQFSTLPANLFADLAKLKTLSISEAGLDTLPEGAFNGLEAVERIDLTLNNLRSLPAGLFEGITKLNNLGLRQTQISTPVDPPAWAVELGLDPDMFRIRTGDETLVFQIHPELVQGNRIVAKVIEGAPFDISVMLSAEGGTLSANKVTIPAGSIKSPFVTVTPLSADRGMVTVKVTYAIFEGWDTFDDPAGACDCWGFRTGPGDPITVDATFATITGEPRVGETLTADKSYIQDPDGMENAVFSYQWLADDADIEDATDSTYDVSEEDVGKGMKVKVSFTDDADNQETLTSGATATVAPRSDNTVKDEEAPVWSADMLVVEYTSVSIGAASADLFSNEGGSAGLQVKSLWSYKPDRDLRLAFEEAVPGAADLTLQVGDLRLAFPAGSSGQSSFRWNDVDVDWEDGQTLAVRIVPTSATAAPQPNNPATGAPTIGGTAQAGETLTANTSGIADTDGLYNAVLSYQWLANDADIQGATNSRYTLSDDDVGKAIKVRVSFTDDANNEETLTSAPTAAVEARLNTPATGLPAINGTVQVGETLTVDTSAIADADGLGNAIFSYQWLADDANIEGATDSTYTLADRDEGKAIKVRVSFTDDGNNEETLTTAATAAVTAKPNTPATGAPTISGTPQVGETLTADTTGIADADGPTNPSFSYQWVVDDGNADADIQDATDLTYKVSDDDVGKTIKVRVSFKDNANNKESLTSAATVVVAATVPGAPRHLTVSPHDTQALDLSWHAPASNGGSDVTGYKVQWKETMGTIGSLGTPADVSEETVTGTTHTINGLTEGVQYTVRVVAVNDVGEGRLSSEAWGTPRETVPPQLDTATANGATLTLNYNERLDATSIPAADTFEVKAGGDGHEVQDVSVEGSVVTLTLASAVASEDTVTVSYTPPTDQSWHRVRDVAGNAPTGFGATQATNETEDEESTTSEVPTRLSVSPRDQGMRLSWTAPEDSTVTGYQILRQRPYECEPTLMVHVDDTGTTATTFIDPDLDRNVRYTYRVKAINGDKISSWSNFATSQYFAPKHVKNFGTPSAPHSLDSVSTVGGIELTWEPPNGEEGITGYQILRKRPEECETSMRVHVENTGSTSTTLMDEDVEVGTKYVYSVAAINANGHGEWSMYANSRQGNGQVVMMSAQDFLTIASGTKTSFSVSASHLPRDNDPDTVDYILRGDVTDTESGEAVDSCEDNNLGTDIEITVVDSVSVQYGGTFGGPGCMAGDYTVHFVVTDADNNEKLAGTLFYYKVTREWDEGSLGTFGSSNNPATGLPIISGTAQVDETLTADTAGIADADGLSGVTYNYQWLSSRDTEIQGATDATYILQASDEGKTIKVRVSFTDDAGNEETLTSAATEVVTSVVNNPATGLPVIRGTAQVGETLTADTSGIADADGLDDATFTYQWLADDANIQGATDSTYTLADSDEGKAIQVKVSFTDDAGNEETLNSAATAAVVGAESDIEPNVGYVTVVVQENNSVPDTPATDFTVTWNDPEECSDGYSAYISGWVGSVLDLGSTDSDGTQIAKTVPQSDLEGGMGYNVEVYCGVRVPGWYIEPAHVPEYGPSHTPVPGTYSSEPGLTGLTVTEGSLAPSFHQYRFVHTLEDVPSDATRITLNATVKAGHSVVFLGDSVTVMGSCNGWECEFTYEEAGSDNKVEPLKDADEDLDGFQMDLADDQTHFSIHVPTVSRIGRVYRFSLSRLIPEPPTEPGGQDGNTQATGLPAISGTAQVGQSLVADTSGIDDADGLTNVSYSYQWIRSDGNTDTDIAGATGSTYTLVSADVGKAIKVKVSFTDDADHEETLTSAATAVVTAAANNPAMGQPTISGTAQVGETLTADITGIADEDGLDNAVFSYQWIRNDGSTDTDIAGATGSTYELGSGDLEKSIKVRVSFEDDAGHQESLTSQSVGPVDHQVNQLEANSPATGAPTISGTVRVGETLTADTSGIADEDGLDDVSYSYQWIAGWSDIDGASGSSHTLTTSEQGQTIQVQVSFTDDQNNEETLTSAATAAVAGAATVPGEPEHLNVSPHDDQGLDLYWEAPASDGGSAITGYKVQWKEAADSWDTEADVSAETVTGTTHTINGLTEGVEYAVRVMASNEFGEGPASAEKTGIPRETRAPEKVRSRVDGATLRVLYDEALDEGSAPPADAFDVRVVCRCDDTKWQDEKARRVVDAVSVNGDTVVLTLASAVTAEDSVVVSYTPPSDEASPRVQDAAGNPAAAIRPTQVFNDTEEANNPATGAPAISGTAQVDETLTTDTSGIADADGLDNATFSYQWIAGGTDIAEATGSSHTLTTSEQGQTIQVRVNFTDDAGHEETLSSETTEAVTVLIWSATLTAGSNETYSGYSLIQNTGELSPDEFFVGVIGYSVKLVLEGDDGLLSFGLEKALPTPFTLRVGELRFASEDASTQENGFAYMYQWDKGSLDWSVGEKVEVSLTMPETPLAVSLENAAATHDGTEVFTFEIRFSEEFALSYQTLRDHAFNVTGGEVLKAQRTDKPSNIPWRITVRPGSNGNVTVVLPVTTDCNAQGAICTGDGRKLSNSLSFTVPGPGG